MQKVSRLTVESLEDRIQPSNWGTPWPYTNVTVSFAPDGTPVNGHASSLFATLNSQASTQAWETQLLRAVQTWAAAGNVNVGLVADAGQAIGAAGLIQGDSRFGDIRFSAEPMGLNGPMAIGMPYDPVAGTYSGDVIFNSSYNFNLGGTNGGADIYTAALHELGHSFGLPDTTNPQSVEYNTYQGVSTGLQPADVAAFQALYGAPPAAAGNNSSATAAAMKQPEVAANLGTGQADYFQYVVPAYASFNVKVTVQNGGISLLMPRVTVLSASGQTLATAVASNALTNTVSITLSNVKPGTPLLLKVDSPSTDGFGTGNFRLKVDSGIVSQVQMAVIDATLNLQNTIVARNFNSSTSTPATAVALDQSLYQFDPRFNYAIDAKINGPSEVDFYSIMIPTAAPQAVLFTAVPGQKSTLSPQVTVYDANGNLVPTQIINNDAGGYVVQLVNPIAGAKYFVAVGAAPSAPSANSQGCYRLCVNYTNSPVVLQTLVDGTVSAAADVNVVSLQSTQVQLYSFVLAVHSTSTTPGLEVLMQLFDANNNLTLSLLCGNGATVSADILLNAGAYTMRFIGYDGNGSAVPLTQYDLSGISLSNPLDPILVNPTTTTTTGTTTPTTTPPTTTTGTTTTLLLTTPTLPPVLPPMPTLPPVPGQPIV